MQELEQLDRILADSDVRPMVDAQLHRVSTPMDDRCPLDYASVMEELDELDEIMAAIHQQSYRQP